MIRPPPRPPHRPPPPLQQPNPPRPARPSNPARRLHEPAHVQRVGAWQQACGSGGAVEPVGLLRGGDDGAARRGRDQKLRQQGVGVEVAGGEGPAAGGEGGGGEEAEDGGYGGEFGGGVWGEELGELREGVYGGVGGGGGWGRAGRFDYGGEEGGGGGDVAGGVGEGGGGGVGGGPEEGVAGGGAGGDDEEGERGDGVVEGVEVGCYFGGGEDVVAVLAVGEVVVAEIRPIVSISATSPSLSSGKSTVSGKKSESTIPRHDNLIIHAIQLHMLQPPPLIHPPRHVFLPQPRQVRRMIHPDLDPLGPELLDQRRQQRRRARRGRLARPAQRVRQHAELQLWFRAERFTERRYLQMHVREQGQKLRFGIWEWPVGTD